VGVIIVVKEEDELSALGLLAIPILVFIIHTAVRIEWKKKYEIFKNYDILIRNKVVKIQDMRKTYYNPPKGVQFNLDMVNKELSKQINEEIKDLTSFVNTYNQELLSWGISYQYRFWGACYTKPEGLKTINLKDYQLY
jgi:hypothetical protein